MKISSASKILDYPAAVIQKFYFLLLKNSGTGNVEAKELICMTHGHELKWGNERGRGCAGQSGIKWGKWDNCNSVINKIKCILKKRRYILLVIR